MTPEEQILVFSSQSLCCGSPESTLKFIKTVTFCKHAITRQLYTVAYITLLHYITLLALFCDVSCNC